MKTRKKTSLIADEPEGGGGWVRPAPAPIDWPALEDAIGRPLQGFEREAVAEAVSRAATLAADARAGPRVRRGRPMADPVISLVILNLWRHLGGPSMILSASPDHASPPVRFAGVILRAAGSPACDFPAIAARLRAVAPN